MIVCSCNVWIKVFVLFNFLLWLQSLIDPLSIYFYAINRTNSSSGKAVIHLYFHIMYQNIISVAHLRVFLSREKKWGQLFNASCVLVVFVTPVCSNKPWYNKRRAQRRWWRDETQLDYTIFLLSVFYQNNQAIHLTGTNCTTKRKFNQLNVRRSTTTQTVITSLNTTPRGFVFFLFFYCWYMKA